MTTPVTIDFIIFLTPSLEGKAVLKGVARARITTREGYMDKDRFALPIPPEPPPHPWVSILLALFDTDSTDSVLLQLDCRKDAASIDTGDKGQQFSFKEVSCYGAFGCIFQPSNNPLHSHTQGCGREDASSEDPGGKPSKETRNRAFCLSDEIGNKSYPRNFKERV